MIDIKNIKAGDRVTIQITGPATLAAFLRAGFVVTDHEPKVVLPTQPGWYIESRRDAGDTDNTLYALTGDGEWSTDGSLRWKPIDADRVPTDLVRLVPEGSERERAFADAVRWLEMNGRFDTANDVREHFGVKP